MDRQLLRDLVNLMVFLSRTSSGVNIKKQQMLVHFFFDMPQSGILPCTANLLIHYLDSTDVPLSMHHIAYQCAMLMCFVQAP